MRISVLVTKIRIVYDKLKHDGTGRIWGCAEIHWSRNKHGESHWISAYQSFLMQYKITQVWRSRERSQRTTKIKSFKYQSTKSIGYLFIQRRKILGSKHWFKRS